MPLLTPLPRFRRGVYVFVYGMSSRYSSQRERASYPSSSYRNVRLSSSSFVLIILTRAASRAFMRARSRRERICVKVRPCAVRTRASTFTSATASAHSRLSFVIVCFVAGTLHCATQVAVKSSQPLANCSYRS